MCNVLNKNCILGDEGLRYNRLFEGITVEVFHVCMECWQLIEFSCKSSHFCDDS
jgi:hypothetical protein